ncbi:putative F-box protein At1g32420 [Olea europaea var. sylvestris]|uniref:putative F-box protein At1g32420 n=1 Tax=Olea europaea var. sylvestris TaxID=158386 RepID=UPI000C1CE603|nr:putative F-box protein At1g32420 [Olea europaea var. sylvestris]
MDSKKLFITTLHRKRENIFHRLLMEDQRVEKKSELPTDLLVDVLSRLPEKTLCRFTCVSKEWNSLISSPHPGFVKALRHQRLHRKSYLYIWDRSIFGGYVKSLHVSIVDTVNERIQENYCLPIKNACIYSVISCHNFLCFVQTKISICNLNTQERAILPDHAPTDHLGHVRIGLGYSSVGKEFKIVGWYTQKKDGMGYSWRLTETHPFEFLSEHSVCVNGVIFWQILNTMLENFFECISLLALDLDEEESQIILSPKLSTDTVAYLVELKECLYLAHCSKGKAIVKMWRLEDQKNSLWISEYYINFSSICNAIVPLSSVLVGHVEELVFISIKGKGLLYYNVESCTIRKPENLENFTLLWYAFPCVLKNMEF